MSACYFSLSLSLSLSLARPINQSIADSLTQSPTHSLQQKQTVCVFVWVRACRRLAIYTDVYTGQNRCYTIQSGSSARPHRASWLCARGLGSCVCAARLISTLKARELCLHQLMRTRRSLLALMLQIFSAFCVFSLLLSPLSMQLARVQQTAELAAWCRKNRHEAAVVRLLLCVYRHLHHQESYRASRRAIERADTSDRASERQRVRQRERVSKRAGVRCIRYTPSNKNKPSPGGM